MFDRIVTIVDGSDASQYAIDASTTIAREDAAELLFCVNLDPTLNANGIGGSALALLATQLGRRILDDALKRARGSGMIQATGRILEDQPAHGVVAFARAHGAGLIVLGIASRARVLRPFTQNLAEEVLRETTIPLCVVRRPGLARWNRRILVPIVDDELSRIGAAYAIKLARSFRSRVVFCTVVSAAGNGNAQAALRRARDDAALAGVTADTVWLPHTGGGISKAIVRSAEVQACDGIVIASHVRQGWPRLIEGSVTEAVFHSSDVPVLIVRAPFVPEEPPRPAEPGNRGSTRL